MLQFPSHGANYEALYKNFGLDLPEVVFDLSENVNSLGIPKQIEKLWPSLQQQLLTYPHPEAEPLRTMIATKHHVQKECVLVGNGGAELLTFYAQLYRGKKVILVHPTFSEYKMTLEAAGADVIDLTISDVAAYQLPIEEIKQVMNDAACLYLCNPNNPTGALISKTILLELIQYGEKVGCAVLIDEAFMDWTDEEHSAIHFVDEFQHVTVLRSMTKMYGIAGIRLGYLIGSPQLVRDLRKRLPHWNVNNLAISIGVECLNDEQFRQQSINYQHKQKVHLVNYLLSRNCIVTSSAANFLCFQLSNPKKTRDFYFHCLKRGVVLRHTENYIGMGGKWLRIGIKSAEALTKFQEVMDEWYA
ncbi:histidinol-phosphate transaminase [Lysinibacillus sp. BW-2-10]|uniref:pyridoxal phosphate-dependent aminotransferase n=1 Tax=Lysinibacillus sp. BW-2-10 TaxID=2590030 RepID=UPI00117E553B|nr:aminotransferase class I/II-fold pyridoxal phosphate-dependent enzyme [Lysinibacillus sp. BW-2-10]TSI10143.1 pyridoxal phosphate-dependent class II aminotransferase [Lysinibacillus sp. BW-2-10]